jgi:hypothetical protein
MVLFGDWRKHYDAVQVLRAGQFDGRRIYVVRLQSDALPPALVSVDAETGDVLRDQRAISTPGGGATPITTTYGDYRNVGGMLVPHRTVTTMEGAGRIVFEVEQVETGVKPDSGTFTLRPRR